jgi:hypothetical protein
VPGVHFMQGQGHAWPSGLGGAWPRPYGAQLFR